ncbi:MAG TPA: PH domain-containing protein [Galbitalea sp.]|nr:PH domain-containing protein [Galbitalea sp.]
MTNRLELPGVEWRRVSRKYVFVDVSGVVVLTILFVVVSAIPTFLYAGSLWWMAPLIVLVLMGAIIAFIPRRVRAIGYQLRDDDLLFRRGLLFQRFVSVPYGRMQLVDITRGPLSRALGLSDLHFVTAAASSGVIIPGLPMAEAEELRDHLVTVAETRRAGL